MLNISTPINHLYKQIILKMYLKYPTGWRATQMSPRHEVTFTYILANKQGAALPAPVFMKHANTEWGWADFLYQFFFPNQKSNVEDTDRNLLATLIKVWTMCTQLTVLFWI
jgi:hypothetical protein